MGKSRQYLTCKACKAYQVKTAKVVCCQRCGAQFDREADSCSWSKWSGWNGNNSWYGEKGNKGKEGKEEFGKGAKGAEKKDTPKGERAAGCFHMTKAEADEWQLKDHDVRVVAIFESLDRDGMMEMGNSGAYHSFKTVFSTICERKFPPSTDDDEDSLVKLLDKARRAVFTAEKSVDTAKEQRLAAKGLLDRADESLAAAEKERGDAISKRDALDLRKAAALVKRTGVAVGGERLPATSRPYR